MIGMARLQCECTNHIVDKALSSHLFHKLNRESQDKLFMTSILAQ